MKFEDIPSTGGSNSFVKLKAGESVRGVFRGDPTIYRTHWVEGRSYVCHGDGCPMCEKGDKPKFRFRLNFVVNENGAYTAKIFEGSYKVYNLLKSLHGADYDLEKTVVRVERQGEKTNTVYTVLPLPGAKGILSEEAEKQISAVKLHELSPLRNAEGVESSEEAEEEVPF